MPVLVAKFYKLLIARPFAGNRCVQILRHLAEFRFFFIRHSAGVYIAQDAG